MTQFRTNRARRTPPRRFTVPGLFCLALAASFLISALAHANPAAATPLPPNSTIAVLPLRGDVEGHSVEPVLQAYRDIGYEVLTPAQTSVRLGNKDNTRACIETAARCDFRKALHALGADALAVVALWQRDGKAHEVVVRIIRAETEGTATQTIDGRPIATAMKAAAASALSRAEHPSVVAVQVKTEPPGALVSVDRRQKGTAPAEFSLSPGKHLFIVSHPGFVTQSSFVDVSESTSSDAGPVVQRFTLKRDAAEAGAKKPRDTSNPPPPLDPGPAETRRPSGWNYGIGAALAAGAVPALVYGIRGAVKAEECEARSAGGRCIDRHEFGPGTGASLGLGTAAALGSAYFFIFQPVRVGVSPYGLGVNVQGNF